MRMRSGGLGRKWTLFSIFAVSLMAAGLCLMAVQNLKGVRLRSEEAECLDLLADIEKDAERKRISVFSVVIQGQDVANEVRSP